jgi:hypothetical protein
MRAQDRLLARLAWALGSAVPALQLVAVGLDGGADGWLQALLDLTGLTVVGLVGALIAARRPTNPYGWLWLALGLAFGAQAVVQASRERAEPHARALDLMDNLLFGAVLVLLLLAFLLFPTGRLPSRAWRWLPRAAVVVITASLAVVLFVPADGGTDRAAQGGPRAALLGMAQWGLLVTLLLILAAAGSVVLRFRRAGPLERQQLKWFALAAGVNGLNIVLDVSGLTLSDAFWPIFDTLSLITIPVAVGVAVLRYRLYEIDRIISRSVSYAVLTAGLVGLYLLVVAVLRPLLEPLTGSSALAVAGSTLAVAAVFNPARRRLQEAVDRRFDRARYDAARAVDAFARRLRDQVDLDQVTAGLHETVVATVAPTRVAVWFRDVPSPSEA